MPNLNAAERSKAFGNNKKSIIRREITRIATSPRGRRKCRKIIGVHRAPVFRYCNDKIDNYVKNDTRYEN